MSTRYFINDTLCCPGSIERELADQPKGNTHYLRGFDDAVESMGALSKTTVISGMPSSEHPAGGR